MKFVIHKHDVTNLHYDFRLAIGSILKSWAIPKGPSLNPKDKRLAIMMPNHTMKYGNFEGVIPEGKYGAGVVMIWDYGTYKNIKKKDGKVVPMKTCVRQGQIEIELKGKKLLGNFALVRMKNKNWLLIKMDDEYASARKSPVKSQNKSAKTDRTLKQIKKDEIY